MASGRPRIASSTSATVTIDGRERVLFAGCDYLSLAHHPRVIEAAIAGLRVFGVSSSGSRETTGNTTAHERLEEDLARFLHVEAALLVPDGYLSNLVVAQSLPGLIEEAVLDRETHVSVRDAVAVRFGGAAQKSGRESATLEYDCADAASARALVERAGPRPRVLWTDGVYPSLGRVAPVRALAALLGPEDLMVVDDCHGLGVLGTHGRGSLEHALLRDERVIVTGTLSKALGTFGGFVAGARVHVERARARAHAYVGSTPVPPAVAQAASAALSVIDDEPERRERLFRHVERVRARLRAHGRPLAEVPFPVFAFTLAPARRAAVSAAFDERGLLVPWIEYPDGMGGCFRLALRAGHTDEQVERLCAALDVVLPEAAQ